MFEAFLAAGPSGLSAVQNMFSSICCFACIAPAGLPNRSFSWISPFINWWWWRWLWWRWLSLKRVLIGGGSGPVVTEGSDSTSVYEAAPPDLGITPSLHTHYTLDLYLSLYFPSVARCNCIVGKRSSQTPQLFSEPRIWGGWAWPTDHLSTLYLHGEKKYVFLQLY